MSNQVFGTASADDTTLRSGNFEGDEGDYGERFSDSSGEMSIVR
jgi:hypothetical protein